MIAHLEGLSLKYLTVTEIADMRVEMPNGCFDIKASSSGFFSFLFTCASNSGGHDIEVHLLTDGWKFIHLKLTVKNACVEACVTGVWPVILDTVCGGSGDGSGRACRCHFEV